MGHPVAETRGGVVVLILGVETATERVSVAIGGHDGVLASVEVTRGRRHAENLMPAIETACRLAEVSVPEFGCVAVDVGPGLFTGMRVGIATATSMAWALDVPVVPSTSLELLALALRDDVERQSERLVCSVVDARKGEVFHQLFRVSDSGVEDLGEPRCETPEVLTARLHERSQSVVCVGDGASRHADVLTGDPRITVAADRWSLPSATTLVELAHRRSLREEWTTPDRVEALYLRQPDAQINWSTRNDAT
jgi:tRNA threonylcarbamoyladenosine biosynthesis protein TsaB